MIGELFSLGVTAEALPANIDWSRHFWRDGSIWGKISCRRGCPPPTVLHVWKTKV